NIRYSLRVEGLTNVVNAEEILRQFRLQSALEAERRHAANAAQIGRRASADADLLEELLRSWGYYDADVEARTEKAGTELSVILAAEPGPQYHFTSVKLPGLEHAGPLAARLRESFPVKSGDPVIASNVISAGVSLTRMLGEEGFA